MKVSPSQPFQIIYSLFQHEYLGYLFESFAIQLDEKGRLTFTHQNISSKNAKEFAAGLDDTDFELIKIMDSMQQEAVITYFKKKKIAPAEFFPKTYDKEKGDKTLQEEIDKYLERRRARVLSLLHGKMLFEMGRDGEPAWKAIEIQATKASVLFHFWRNEDNTHYYPTIKYQGEKLDFQYKGAYIICKKPAWMVLGNRVFSFEKEVDGHKLMPFLNKKFMEIPRRLEKMFFDKFVRQLIAAFDVKPNGFDIHTIQVQPKMQIVFSELATAGTLQSPSLFGNNDDVLVAEADEGNMLFDISISYLDYKFKTDNLNQVHVTLHEEGDNYIFHKVKRDMVEERILTDLLKQYGMQIKHSKALMPKSKALEWIHAWKDLLAEKGIELLQHSKNSKKYFIGKSSITLEVRESIDWFDIHATVRFGDYEVNFKELRKMMLKNQREFDLPNGETAVIPDAWFNDYGQLLAFSEEGKNGVNLRKHHLALVEELEMGENVQVIMNRKLQALRNFQDIEDQDLSQNFKGTLRPYQKAGFNWLLFLNQFNFGGCLADDMGLGKTVQTLAMLQKEKDKGQSCASLLVMPTSLIYNWEKEAAKFTPNLKVLNYTGTNRVKDVAQFADYDLILSSYGIVRLDFDILKDYAFHYIILDESQAIKNPLSNISKAVKQLKSKHRLVLTGTPIENSTLDLWSQMTFANPGLLGNQNFFKKEFLQPIEKKKDEHKLQKLHSLIKPFILRRHKSQVATDLPPKTEKVFYSSMSTEQENRYEEVKAKYREEILDKMETEGIAKSQMILLQGLTQLRQIANHPAMVDQGFAGKSGKMEDVLHMLETALADDHKILIFSQFVKHLALVREELDARGLNYSYLDGSTKNRKDQVETFQQDEEVRIFLISLKAGGLGLNLTKADYVFILDPWWNPAIEAQAVDRAHRIGQENKVFTYKFITKNTVEEKILQLQEQKLSLAQNLISTEESFVKNLSKEDIKSLLE